MDLEIIANAIREQSVETTYNLYNYGLIGATMGLFSTYVSSLRNKKERKELDYIQDYLPKPSQHPNPSQARHS